MSTAIAILLALATMLGTANSPDAPTGGVPSVIVLDKLANLHTTVTFSHKNHAAFVDGCRSCHHKKFGDPLSCGECHSELVEHQDFVHGQHEPLMDCFTCHQVKTVTEMNCSYCHKTPYDPVQLHVIGLKGALHQQCMGCHRQVGLDVSCTTCHQER